MKIKSEFDLKEVSDRMHDSEFNEKDFEYKAKDKIFQISSITPNEKFTLKLYNVTQYDPINLNKVKRDKATAGVFDEVKIRKNGHDLTIISQDLKIKLKLSSIDGEFLQEVR